MLFAVKAVRTPAALRTSATTWMILRRDGQGQAERASVCVRAHVGGFMRVGTLVFSKAPFLHAVKRTSLPVRDENISPPPLPTRAL